MATLFEELEGLQKLQALPCRHCLPHINLKENKKYGPTSLPALVALLQGSRGFREMQATHQKKIHMDKKIIIEIALHPSARNDNPFGRAYDKDIRSSLAFRSKCYNMFEPHLGLSICRTRSSNTNYSSSRWKGVGFLPRAVAIYIISSANFEKFTLATSKSIFSLCASLWPQRHTIVTMTTFINIS